MFSIGKVELEWGELLLEIYTEVNGVIHDKYCLVKFTLDNPIYSSERIRLGLPLPSFDRIYRKNVTLTLSRILSISDNYDIIYTK